MPQGESGPLRDSLGHASTCSGRYLWGAAASVRLSDLVDGSGLDCRLADLQGRSVLIATADQLTTAVALIELDGVARRLTLCPPDLAPEHLASVIANSQVDAIVTDR